MYFMNYILTVECAVGGINAINNSIPLSGTYQAGGGEGMTHTDNFVESGW